MSNELTVLQPAELVRRDSDVAGLCKELVTRTACNIQGRNYVKCEGWQSIATAHGCCAGARDVEFVQGGCRCIGELRRLADGAIIATAEGFVGEDEPTWYGGDNGRGKILPKRPDYAIRAMCQTRAISRVCRSAFAHVVVLMNAGLETTPAEEVPHGGFDDAKNVTEEPPAPTNGATCSEPMIKRLYALAKGAGQDTTSLADRLAERFAYVRGADGVHLTKLHRTDYQAAEALATAAAEKQAEEIPMGDEKPAAGPLPLPKGVKEIWPETEFGDNTEVIVATVVDVRAPVAGKSGKLGPHKVDIQTDGGVVTVDTFDETLAALAQAYGAGGEQHEIAFQTTVNGKWTNRKLVGLR